MTNALQRTVVNNALLDPLQGYDIDMYIQDQGTGKQIMIGAFTSFQFTMRNSSEPYLEFNQRTPRILDGEMQYGWVIERGLIDVRVMQQTFGVDIMSRSLKLSRMPRFQITLLMDAPELEPGNTSAAQNQNASANSNSFDFRVGLGADSRVATRKAQGKYVLTYAKTDALTIGAMAGRNIVATRWEGLCEGVYFKDLTENELLQSGLTQGGGPSDILSGGRSVANVKTQNPLTFGSIKETPDWSALTGGGQSNAPSDNQGQDQTPTSNVGGPFNLVQPTT